MPLDGGHVAFTGPDGAPVAGGRLYTYAPGTTVPKATYSNAAGTVANTNPVVLDAYGKANVWWDGIYKVVLADANGVTLWSIDQVSSMPLVVGLWDAERKQYIDEADQATNVRVDALGEQLEDSLAAMEEHVQSVVRYDEDLVAGVVGGHGAFQADLPGAATRTFQDKERERITPLDIAGCKGDGATVDRMPLQALLNTFKRSPVASVIANAYGSTPVEVDLAGRTYLLDGSLDFADIYNLTIRNGRLLASAYASWGESPMVSLAGPLSAANDSRNQRIRDVSFIGVRFDGNDVANCVFIQHTSGLTFEGCTAVRFKSGGYGFYAPPNPQPGTGYVTKSSRLRLIRCDAARSDVNDESVTASGRGFDINCADFQLMFCKSWRTQYGIKIDYASNFQIIGDHTFTTDGNYCLWIGPEASGGMITNFYSDTGIVELRSFDHTLSGCGFIANSTFRVVATKVGENLAGLLVTGSKFQSQPAFVLEGAATWAEDVYADGTKRKAFKCDFIGNRKQDGGRIKAPAALRLHRGTRYSPAIQFADIDAVDSATGIYSKDDKSIGWVLDTIPIWGIDENGKFNVGQESGAATLPSASPIFQVNGGSTQNATGSIIKWASGSVIGGQAVVGRSNSDTYKTNAALISGQQLGQYAFNGDTGAGFSTGALLSAVATGAWTASSTPAKLIFSTNPSGSATVVARWEMADAGHLAPAVDNTLTVGQPSQRVSVVYAGTSTISTSDASRKTPVRTLVSAELAAGRALAHEIGIYQFLDAVAAKGADLARLHAGMTVQRAIDVMQAHGIEDPMRYGFICLDAWDEQPEVVDEAGNVVQPRREAGQLHSFRTDELLMFMLAGVAADFEARLAALEGA